MSTTVSISNLDELAPRLANQLLLPTVIKWGEAYYQISHSDFDNVQKTCVVRDDLSFLMDHSKSLLVRFFQSVYIWFKQKVSEIFSGSAAKIQDQLCLHLKKRAESKKTFLSELDNTKALREQTKEMIRNTYIAKYENKVCSAAHLVLTGDECEGIPLEFWQYLDCTQQLTIELTQKEQLHPLIEALKQGNLSGLAKLRIKLNSASIDCDKPIDSEAWFRDMAKLGVLTRYLWEPGLHTECNQLLASFRTHATSLDLSNWPQDQLPLEAIQQCSALETLNLGNDRSFQEEARVVAQFNDEVMQNLPPKLTLKLQKDIQFIKTLGQWSVSEQIWDEPTLNKLRKEASNAEEPETKNKALAALTQYSAELTLKNRLHIAYRDKAKDLDLGSVKFGVWPGELLAYLPHLQVLRWQAPPDVSIPKSFDAKAFVQTFPQLQHFSLPANMMLLIFGVIDCFSTAISPRLKQLGKLATALSTWHAPQAAKEALMHCALNESKVLKLNGFNLTDLPVHCVELSDCLKHVREFVLANNDLTVMPFIQIRAWMPKLESLDISYNALKELPEPGTTPLPTSCKFVIKDTQLTGNEPEALANIRYFASNIDEGFWKEFIHWGNYKKVSRFTQSLASWAQLDRHDPGYGVRTCIQPMLQAMQNNNDLCKVLLSTQRFDLSPGQLEPWLSMWRMTIAHQAFLPMNEVSPQKLIHVGISNYALALIERVATAKAYQQYEIDPGIPLEQLIQIDLINSTDKVARFNSARQVNELTLLKRWKSILGFSIPNGIDKEMAKLLQPHDEEALNAALVAEMDKPNCMDELLSVMAKTTKGELIVARAKETTREEVRLLKDAQLTVLNQLESWINLQSAEVTEMHLSKAYAILSTLHALHQGKNIPHFDDFDESHPDYAALMPIIRQAGLTKEKNTLWKTIDDLVRARLDQVYKQYQLLEAKDCNNLESCKQLRTVVEKKFEDKLASVDDMAFDNDVIRNFLTASLNGSPSLLQLIGPPEVLQRIDEGIQTGQTELDLSDWPSFLPLPLIRLQ